MTADPQHRTLPGALPTALQDGAQLVCASGLMLIHLNASSGPASAAFGLILDSDPWPDLLSGAVPYAQTPDSVPGPQLARVCLLLCPTFCWLPGPSAPRDSPWPIDPSLCEGAASGDTAYLQNSRSEEEPRAGCRCLAHCFQATEGLSADREGTHNILGVDTITTFLDQLTLDLTGVR